jgi:hypothetical protein
MRRNILFLVMVLLAVAPVLAHDDDDHDDEARASVSCRNQAWPTPTSNLDG